MPRDVETTTETSRRSVVPDAAGRSLWLAAAWTGVGAAVVCATIAIVFVAALWLPVSGGSSGRTGSAIRAGLLTFLAALHGGITVDGVSGNWLPLGMMIAVGITAWRAGSGLADVAAELDEQDPARLIVAGAAQSLSFMVAAVVVVPFATLGTSHASIVGVGLSALLLFALTGGVAFIRSTPLRERLLAEVPAELQLAARGVAAMVTVYLGFGALLVLGSLMLHHREVEELSRQVGGGWGGVPILLLGILSAPNAAIAGASYLAGPGFALGHGTSVSLTGTAHGTLPAFPVLAAVPSGSGAGPVVWVLAALLLVAGGALLARLAARVPGLVNRLRVVAAGALGTALVMTLLGWQGGGSVGAARLSAVGPSPWRLGLATGLEVGVVAAVAVAAAALLGSVRHPAVTPVPGDAVTPVPVADWTPTRTTTLRAVTDEPAEDAQDGKLAG
ncbi:DUF6350 family protein [Jatrophihabitans sp.]|uniref:cell division protein PerM n=1 Tax=Jatrophihabitans sp. TaxID=1932789 RepID=UPI0030C77038|nr:hypothetical protein [Jatrophihabitans sp.]